MRSVESISAHIASFLDFCRIEKGLSRTTITAYRADLERFAASLQSGDQLANPTPVRHYVDSLYQAGMASRSIARHIATLRNFFAHLIEKGALNADPTAHLAAPRQWQSLPKYLNKQQIDDLLAACDGSKPQGSRDRAMLEFLYATGLRVSELCKVRLLELEMNLGVVRVVGKGNKHRIVPVGKSALEAVERYLGNGRPRLLKGRASPFLFVTNRGGAMTRQGFWTLLGGLRQEGWDFPQPDAARAAPHLRDASAGRRGGLEKPAEHVGARRHIHYADLYPCSAFAVAENRGRASSESLSGFEEMQVCGRGERAGRAALA